MAENFTNKAKQLSNQYPEDLNLHELTSELESYKFIIKKTVIDISLESENVEFVTLYDRYCSPSLRNIYPNMHVCYRIFLTLPVTSPSCERSFSKLKIIKKTTFARG